MEAGVSGRNRASRNAQGVHVPEYVTISAATARTQLTISTRRTGLPKRPPLASTAVSTTCFPSFCTELSYERSMTRPLRRFLNPYGPFNVVGRTRQVITGHNGEDGRRAISPVSACDISASVGAYILFPALAPKVRSARELPVSWSMIP